jgi:hypothetical protein
MLIILIYNNVGITYLDFENQRDNPVEDKYRTLAHDLLRGLVDRNRFDPLQCITYVDHENELDNLVEDKYRTLAHDLLRGLVDPAVKPNKEQRKR